MLPNQHDIKPGILPLWDKLVCLSMTATYFTETSEDLEPLFEGISRLRVGIIGDFALDLYYNYTPETGEQSLETGLTVHWGARPGGSLGAAGNVVQNLVALGVQQVWAVGCVGPDLFGREMRHLLNQHGVHTDHLLTANGGWDTCVYTKPMRGPVEANRIDFGSQNTLHDSLFEQLLNRLDKLLRQLDVLIINQQFRCPLLTADRSDRLNALIRQHPSVCYVADMRDVGLRLRGVTLKVNTTELARFLGQSVPEMPGLAWCLEHGRTLSKQIGGALVVTRGQSGIVYINNHDTWSVDGLTLPGPLDTVGAGDTVVAALAAALSAGATPPQALRVANLAAAVTVQKLGQTGTATPAEIRELLITYSVYEPANDSTTPAGNAPAPDPGTAPILGEP